ncbi:hypothetical protein AXA44_20220 [Rhodococcus sp. SC4]|nr:hypothetical protein AXA44_20220 [Rhodococcus sp. SC4]
MMSMAIRRQRGFLYPIFGTVGWGQRPFQLRRRTRHRAAGCGEADDIRPAHVRIGDHFYSPAMISAN